jgi:lambda repressor-like predicted transcriptional regulator
MASTKSTETVPTDLRARRAWIIFQLHSKGLSLASLADEQGVSRQAMTKSLVQPNARAEEVVAKAIGLAACELFPERFDAFGVRLFQQRRRQAAIDDRSASRRKVAGQ